MLAYLMVFKLVRRPIKYYCCRLAWKNISHTMRFALKSLTTSAAPYMTILTSKLITHLFFVTN